MIYPSCSGGCEGRDGFAIEKSTDEVSRRLVDSEEECGNWNLFK